MSIAEPMSLALPTYHEIVQAVRSSRCMTSKKQNPAKKRVGIYGPTLERAKSRLAGKLKVSDKIIPMISMYVDELLRRGKLRFTGNRLTIVKGRDKMHKRNRSIPAPAVDINVIGVFHATPADSSVDARLAAWPEYASELGEPTGDLFRRYIWGDEVVPTVDAEKWLKKRTENMANHPSASHSVMSNTA
jgi:hypothetical protein